MTVHDYRACTDEHCEECQALVDNGLVMACDECDSPGSTDSDAWHLLPDGRTLCVRYWEKLVMRPIIVDGCEISEDMIARLWKRLPPFFGRVFVERELAYGYPGKVAYVGAGKLIKRWKQAGQVHWSGHGYWVRGRCE
jgi:hypothetical protein